MFHKKNSDVAVDFYQWAVHNDTLLSLLLALLQNIRCETVQEIEFF